MSQFQHEEEILEQCFEEQRAEDFDTYGLEMDHEDLFSHEFGSHLHPETDQDPRNQSCPTCGAVDALNALDIASGFHCEMCARAAERAKMDQLKEKKLFCDNKKHNHNNPPLIHNCETCRTCPMCWALSGMPVQLKTKENVFCKEHIHLEHKSKIMEK